MNALGVALVWCAVQVTALGLAAGALYLMLRRLWPAAGSAITLTGLIAVIALSATIASPWPRWSLDLGQSRTTATAAPAAESASRAAIELPSADSERSPAPATSPELLPESESAAALFLHALADELAKPGAEPEAAGWRWSGFVAVAFLVAVAVGGVWLAVGLWAVRSYRRRGRPIRDAELLEMVDVLRAELSCRRPIELRACDRLVAAATVGWRRPVVLLPAEWTTWTAPQRRAVLAHEIAHVRARHFLGVVLGQLGLALHFYHPLVHWLMSRLRLEQELEADAAAAGVMGGKREYLTTIAELALRQSDRPLVWPARSFLPTRNSFVRRIAMLRDVKLRHDRLAAPARALVVAAVLLCGVLVAGLRGPASDAGARAAQPQQGVAGGADSSEAIDLAYVPPSASMFMAVRPAAIFARPELDELRKLLNEGSAIRSIPGLPVEEIEQVAVALPPIASLRPSSPPTPLVIVRTTNPRDFAPLAERVVRNAVPGKHKGRPLWVGHLGSGEGTACFCPDDRTAVFGSYECVLSIPAASEAGPPAFLDEASWQEYRESHLVAAVNAPDARAILDAAHQASVFAPLAPLWRDTTTIVIGGRVTDRLRIRGRATSGDGEAAQRVAQTLEATRVLARNFAERLRAEAEAPWVVVAAFGLVADAKVEREGELVRIESSFDLASLGPMLRGAREATRRVQSTNNLKQLALAMHNFHDAYKRFPPAAARESKTRVPQPDAPPHSWRVALLPFLERADLYDRYRFDEPWDGPHNIELLEEMPAVYRHPDDPADSTTSAYYVLTGPGTVFDDDDGTRIAEIRDGTSNTLLIVEADRKIPWTKPEDLAVDPDEPLPKLGGYTPGGFNAALCDGSVRFVAETMDEQMLRAAILKADGQVVTWPDAPRTVPPPPGAARRDAPQPLRDAPSKLKQIGLAMHNYHDQHRRLPGAALSDKGPVPYSWRVALLPYLGPEEKRLYEQYRFDEPWDGPNNRKLLDKIPAVYAVRPGGSPNASVFVLAGPGTVFDKPEGSRFADIRDGTSNTILAVVARRDIPWTKPEDLPYDPARPIPELGDPDEPAFHALLCDGSVRLIPQGTDEPVLRALIEKSDGRRLRGQF